ncbi:substrate-binding domain-containing protein [Providencia hangzhouensis]
MSFTHPLTLLKQPKMQHLYFQQKPNIVFCDDDLLAGALYRAAKQLNITIPKDVAVIGFNDTDLCNYLNPELSTVKIPTQYIGELAIKMLLDKISDRKEPIKQEVIKLEIITRGSTQF